MCLSHKLGLTAAMDVTLKTHRQFNTILMVSSHIALYKKTYCE